MASCVHLFLTFDLLYHFKSTHGRARFCFKSLVITQQAKFVLWRSTRETILNWEGKEKAKGVGGTWESKSE